MEEDATVSVVIPYRDVRATLDEAMVSTLADLGRTDELIAVDDGSTDGSSDVVDGFARRDRRVRAVRASSRGIAAALALGVAHARGSLIARMDGDDVTLPGRFDVQRRALLARPSLAVVGVHVEAFPAPGPGMAAYVAWQNGLIDEADHARDIFVESPLCHPSTMIRRSALEHVGGFRDAPWAEDYDLWFRLHAAGYGLAKIPELLFRWRLRPDSVTRTDPRTSEARLLEGRAHYLAAHLDRCLRRTTATPRTFVVWGAGQTGRRLARALERHELRPAFFVDVDPRKIGRSARERPIVEAEAAMVRARHEGLFVVVGVGARGARAVVRARLRANGFHEGHDFVCAA